MKFSLSWLKQHLDTDASLPEILDAMVSAGLEVESVDDPAERLKAFTIGEVLEANPHPDADKLRVCTVRTKDGDLQIVCGAPNARAGIKIAFAPVGAYVPGIDTTLSKAKIRGVESSGMMCSARELELGDDHDGIIEAPASATVGEPVAAVLGANDPVIDFEVTPNRPDTNGVDGVARDLAAAGIGRLITPAPQPVKGSFPCPQKIGLVFPDDAKNACPVFAGRVIRNIRNGESPKWLRDRLRAIGLRPINALVDVTNFLSYDRARPLHVYDADKLSGVIRARLGAAGESFLALDGREYAVDEAMCVIADGARVLGLGGVMGGEETGCTEETTSVFIESAYFDPTRTAKTGRKTGIVSDARYRFERGVDPAFVVPGLEMATRLILDICGGEASEIEIAGAPPIPDRTIAFNPARVKKLTGLDTRVDESARILTALGFSVERPDAEPAHSAKDMAAPAPRWRVGVPSWRPDIEGEADLVEEVARIVGFDSMPAATLPPIEEVPRPKYSVKQDRVRNARRTLASRGWLEAVTWSFCDEGVAALFGACANTAVRLSNPIASDLGVMRPSALVHLLAALQKNADRGRADLALFEVGPQYAGDRPQDQATVAAGARRAVPPRHWQGADTPADVFTAKADALAVLTAAGARAESLQTAAEAPDWYHPGRSGALKLGPKTVLAYFGEAHPRVLKALDVEGPVLMFEAFLDRVPEPKAKGGKTRAALNASQFLPFTRDFAFVVDTQTLAETLVRAVRGADKQLIANVRVFDVYEGKGVPDGKKSIAIEVTIQPRARTLTEDDIEALTGRIVSQAQKAAGAVLRA